VGPHPPVDLLTEVVCGGLDAGGGWPAPVEQRVHRTVAVVCWGTVRGLGAARAAVRQHAVGEVPQYVALAGLVVVRLPGRPARAVAALERNLAGGVPNLWRVPWCERWTTDPAGSPLTRSRPVLDLAAELSSVAETSSTEGPVLLSGKETSR
jgi:hypothetical protein